MIGFAPPTEKPTKLARGTKVRKVKGYEFDGFVVAAFKNRAGFRRYVVEHAESRGMLHIFSPEQLVVRK